MTRDEEDLSMLVNRMKGVSNRLQQLMVNHQSIQNQPAERKCDPLATASLDCIEQLQYSNQQDYLSILRRKFQKMHGFLQNMNEKDGRMDDELRPEEIKRLQQELRASIGNYERMTLIIRRAQLLQAGIFTMETASFPEQKSADTVLQDLVQKTKQNIIERDRKVEGMLELHKKYMELSKEKQLLQLANRDLRQDTLQDRRQLAFDAYQKHKNSKRAEASNKVNTAWSKRNSNAKRENFILRHTLQHLILGSGIDWVEDDNLVELIHSLEANPDDDEADS